MIAQIDPEELMKYKDKIDPKYKNLFQNIQEDDNPIVICNIGRCFYMLRGAKNVHQMIKKLAIYSGIPPIPFVIMLCL